MNDLSVGASTAGVDVEHFDVLIVGAGISGIGAAYHLTTRCPDSRFAVLDVQDDFGGTWLTHKYPGIRSDSDMYTFGYSFKPWTDVPIASGEKIRAYLGEVIEEHHLARHFRYRHRVTTARWSSVEKLWTVDAVHTETGATFRFTANFLWMCQGYYRHQEGYTPEWDGMDQFRGRIVHPETWPENLDYKDRKVVLIGSGATAATMVPAIAPEAAHVTMLQRSPTYFLAGSRAFLSAMELAEQLRTLQVDESWVHEILRRKIAYEQTLFTRRTFEEPDAVRAELIGAVREMLGPDYDVETHFTPSYRPWQQRLALVPNGDFFESIRAGKASVVTDEIERFTEGGILLRSGQELSADVIVTATGFNLSVLGDIDFVIDGRELNFADTVTYRGMMFTGVPNLVWVFGYLRASWTLRVDLVSDFVCRLLEHMREKHARQVEVALRPEDRHMKLMPWIEEENFNAGYIKRGLALLPRCGDKPEWAHTQNYWSERDEIPAIDLDDPAFVYS